MVEWLPLTTNVLTLVCLVLATVQAVIPGRRVWGRYSRLGIQLFLTIVHFTAASLTIRAERLSGYTAYIATSVAYLFTFGLIDLAREGAFHLRAQFSDLPLATVPATIATTLLAIFHICVSFTLLLIAIPSNVQLNYCGHRRYILRDVGPCFGGFVYGIWAIYEFAGAFSCGPWTRSVICGTKMDTRDDDERAIWIQHRVAAAVGAEATLEIIQVILVLCTVVYTCTIAETASRRVSSCSGVISASTRAMPLFAISSATLAGRFFAARLREVVLTRMS